MKSIIDKGFWINIVLKGSVFKIFICFSAIYFASHLPKADVNC